MNHYHNFKFSLPLPLTLIIGMFILWLIQRASWLGMLIIERSELVKYAIIEGALLVGAFYTVFITSVVNRKFSRKKKYEMEKGLKQIFILMFIWILVSIAAMLEGLALGNNPNYILGDFYKFLRPALLFFLMYYSIETLDQIYSFYFIVIIIWLLWCLIEIIVLRSQIFKGYRLMSYGMVLGGTFLPVCLFFTQITTKKYVKAAASLGIILCIITAIISQCRGEIVKILLITSIYFIFLMKANFTLARKIRIFLFTLICFFLTVILAWTILNPLFLSLIHRFIFTKYESHYLMLTNLGYTKYTPIGLSRLLEAQDALKDLFGSPLKVILGSGMGAEYNSLWGVRHHIHTCLTEVFFRTGTLGLISFLSIFSYFLKYAICKIKTDIYFLLSAVIGAGGLLFFVLGLGGFPIVHWILIIPIFVGMFKIKAKISWI